MTTDLSLVVDTTVYSLDVVHRAAFWFTKRCRVRIERTSEQAVCVTFAALGQQRLDGDLLDEFQSALVDYRIRETLASETAAIRDLIYRQAFVEADL